MNTQSLYDLIETAFNEEGFNLNGVWNRMTYTSKMLLCQRMIDNGSWESLPASVIWLKEEVL